MAEKFYGEVIKLGFKFGSFEILQDLGRNNSAKTKSEVSRCRICFVRSESQSSLQIRRAMKQSGFSKERRERKNS